MESSGDQKSRAILPLGHLEEKAMAKTDTHRESRSRWLRLLAGSISMAVVLSAVSFVTTHSQQTEEPPEGYLGPMVPIPIDGDPNPSPGDLGVLQATVLPNVLVNDRVDDAPDQTQSETTIAVDPTNPLRLIGGFNDCRGFFVPSRNGISGWGFSADGGATWTGVQTGLPKFAPGDFGARGDPSIDVDAQGNFYYASLYQRVGVGQLLISVHKGGFVGSTFTWNTPTFATSPPVNADKEHLGVDRRPGSQTVYVSYTNFGVSPRTIEVVRSTDGGATWSMPVVLASGDVQGSVPRVGPDGELYVAWATWPGTPRTLRIRKSTNWPNFDPEVLATTMTAARNPLANSRNPQFPGMDIDRTSGPNRGRVYLTFDDGRLGGAAQVGTIFLVHSPDGSAGSWSAPIRLDDDPQPPSTTGTDRWFSWPSVDARGVVHIGWYDRRLRPMPPGNQTLTDTFATQFRVGTAPSANVRLTSQSYPMNVPSRCTPNFGDYNGSAVGPTRFHFLYGDGRLGNPDTFVAGVIASPILVSPTNTEACRATPTTTTITVLGGAGLFVDDVTLRLAEVSPAEPTITATFDPNPVPRPPAEGRTSRMTINTTGDTPPGTYNLKVEGTDGTLTETVDVTLVVRSQAPTAPVLLEPLNDADSVLETATFRWEAAEQATTYRLEIFLGATRVRVFDNIAGTQFTIPNAQALDFFQRYTWRLTAKNACGETVSAQTFTFRTLSCTAPAQDFAANGGFEQDLGGWVIDAAVPTPTATTERPRSGLRAATLGVIAPEGTPTFGGDSEIHQTFTIPEAARDPRLIFWFWPQSFDTVTNDQQEVFVVPATGAPVLLMRVARNDRAYVRQEFSLAAFRGSTIEIHFRVRNGGDTNPTGMFVDDVSVTMQSCGPPDFFITAIPPLFNEVCAGDAIEFTVRVDTLNGPNFTSPVQLSASNLPPGAAVTFERNPIAPGTATRMTLFTARPTIGNRYLLNIGGAAVEPPPTTPRVLGVSTLISANEPLAPEQITPTTGEVNVSRRPTLTWTDPFVPDSLRLPALGDPGEPEAGTTPAMSEQSRSDQGELTFFGAARYRVQVARDPLFADLVVDTEVAETRLTLPAPLDIATQYYWRVNARNACSTSPWSAVQSFVVGACFETVAARPPVPIAGGLAQHTVVAARGRLYVIGGAVGAGLQRIRQVWEFNPDTDAWSRKADIPEPGPGSTFGSAAELGGKIYVFGGFFAAPLNTLFIYDIATDTWSRGRDLPSANFGIAVAVAGNRIILATGSGFGNQTWEYDPATDTYTRLADAPITASRMHADVIGDELHAFAGGFDGFNHVIYNTATNAWRIGPRMPFGVTDPGVVALGGKFFVLGGRRPISPRGAIVQIFDPQSNTWSQGPELGLNWLDNTDADAVGVTIHVVGGFDGASTTNVHRSFDVCGATSALQVPYVVDGDGTVADVPNETTSLLVTNAVAGRPVSATAFLYRPDGTVDSSLTFSIGPNALLNLENVVREVRGASGVQNFKGSLAIFASNSLQATANVVSSTTGDGTIVDGQALAGPRSGFVPLIQLGTYRTHTAFRNLSTRAASVEMRAYPPEGGSMPLTSAAFTIPPHGLADFQDVAGQLGLPMGHVGQLSWNADQPVATIARDVTADSGFSGTQPERRASDGARTLVVAHVEDNEIYRSKLQVSNLAPFSANVTVRFVDIGDPSGGSAGTSTSRDVLVRTNSATITDDVIRWVLRDASGVPSGKRGFLVITSPQLVTALATTTHNGSLDPSITDTATLLTASFTPAVVSFAPDGSSRVAISNSGTTPATVELRPFNRDGTPARAEPFVVEVVAGGQFFTDDIVAAMGLPSEFFGWLVVNANAPVAVSHQRKAGNTGMVMPIYRR